QYFVYLKDTLTGDLGESLRTRAPVSEEIWPYLAGTLELAIFAMVIAVFIGINAGIVSAWFQNSWFDYIRSEEHTSELQSRFDLSCLSLHDALPISQYFVYLKDTLTGDLGESLRTRAPVSEEIWPYLAGTLELAIFAMVIAVFIGINAGIVSAWFQNSWFDYI